MVGDLLAISSKVLELKDKSIRFVHIMTRADTGEEVATSELVGVHIDRDKRVACPFPSFVRKRVEEISES